MQKDYTTTEHPESSADTFAEKHWTDIWDRMRDRMGDARVAAADKKFRLMEPWIRRLPKNARVLDGGCGLGHWTLFMRSLGFAPEGIDISHQTIAALREKYPDVPFSFGDIRTTGYPDASFDAYFSWGTFEHFEDGMEAPIREAWRILKSGGFLIITVPFQNLRHLLHGPAGLQKNTPVRFYQWRFTKRELKYELASRGFDVLSITPTSKDQGASRFVLNDLHLPKGTLLARAAIKAVMYLFPASWIAHMLFAVAQKPE